jgi:hypothetical protein
MTPQEQASALLALWQLMRELEPRERVQKLELAEYAEILDAVAQERWPMPRDFALSLVLACVGAFVIACLI